MIGMFFKDFNKTMKDIADDFGSSNMSQTTIGNGMSIQNSNGVVKLGGKIKKVYVNGKLIYPVK